MTPAFGLLVMISEAISNKGSAVEPAPEAKIAKLILLIGNIRTQFKTN
jgi:hypothetical protein